MTILRTILTPWTVLAALLIGLLLTGATAWYLYETRPAPAPPGVPTAQLAVIPAPMATPPIPTAAPVTSTPTLEIPPSPLPGTFTQGTLVQITGTGQDGLNLREEPGLDSGIEYLGFEAEVFTIENGPVDADGLAWWYIVGFADPNRAGWAAENFLAVVQAP